MLLLLTEFLSKYIHAFRVFQYLTFRSIVAALTALAISLIFSPKLIRIFSKKQLGQQVRDDGPQMHKAKSGTPTMGGSLILMAVFISMILWSNWNVFYVWMLLLATLGFGLIGGFDDYKKIQFKNSDGLSARAKYICQSIVALLVVSMLYYHASTPQQTELIIPFFKNAGFQLGIFYIILGYFVIVGSSNAVNLTDGLDGLALLPTVMVAAALGLFAYLEGNEYFSHYLVIPHIAHAGEITVFCSSLVGAGLGFLWYNTYPADVFMGDVGSLALGAALGTVAIIVRQELVLFIMGGVFVLETLSVIIQVVSFKLTGKRVFRMAPLHHHFELKGWPEPRVIVRFWIITFFLVLCGLATLKLR